MEKITEQLHIVGLNHNDIKVYLYLLREGVASPSQIARGTGIARTNTYHILRTLDDMNLIERRRHNSRFVYAAENPTSLLRAVEARKEAIESILPDLHDLYKVQRNKPIVEYYDGLERVEDIFSQTLESEDAIRSVESTHLLYTIDELFFKTYDKKLRDKQIFTKDLLTPGPSEAIAKRVAELQGVYYEYRLIPKKSIAFEGQILIWNDNVAHISLEQPYFGTIMHSKPIASVMRTLFDLAWERADKTN